MSQRLDASSAFLQDIRPRAEVFAQLLCGDRQRANAALMAAMRAFRGNSAPATVDMPADHWPLRLWTLLLARPELCRPAPHACWAPPLTGLERLEPGERAAVLLRLVAGLDDADGATVLGISQQTLRRAFQRALPRRPDGEPDHDTWRAWATAIDAMQRNATPRAAQAPVASATRPAGAPRWLRPTLWAALVACAIGLAASFLLPVGRQDGPGTYVQGTPLPPADAPASTYDADTAVLTHRDFDQLMDARADALVRDLDFYAWYAAQVASQPGADGGPLLLPDAGTPVSPTTPGGTGAR
ncbi:MAG: sigma-70 region 4 domain-containing protein [Luteimonas sp.]